MGRGRLIDVSHAVEHGLVTSKGLPDTPACPDTTQAVGKQAAELLSRLSKQSGTVRESPK